MDRAIRTSACSVFVRTTRPAMSIRTLTRPHQLVASARPGHGHNAALEEPGQPFAEPTPLELVRAPPGSVVTSILRSRRLWMVRSSSETPGEDMAPPIAPCRCRFATASWPVSEYWSYLSLSLARAGHIKWSHRCGRCGGRTADRSQWKDQCALVPGVAAGRAILKW